jgi:WD40 repeat protein
VGEADVVAGHVFVSYAREDARHVDVLQHALESAGIRVWRDTADLWPGEDWRAKIRHEITGSTLVFLACFSRRSLARKAGYQNEEITLAIEQLRLRRPDQPWLIPVRFDDCDVPELSIGGGRTLATIQRADLFGDSAENEIRRLTAAVRRILSRNVANLDRAGTEPGVAGPPLSCAADPPTVPAAGPPSSARAVRDAQARLGVSSSGVLSRFPALAELPGLAYRATLTEICRRTGTLAGRQEELASIASFATGDEGYRWLAGDAWAGKTSLLAEAATTLPGHVDAVCYFLSRREADADSSRFLAAVIPQLAGLLGVDAPAAELHQFRALWQRAAGQAGLEGRHLLLVVDGLDEDLRPPGLPSVAALLPAAVGGGAHVLVSSRPHPGLPADVPAGHPLHRARPVPVTPFPGARELAVLARQEIADLLRHDDDGLAADVLGLLTAAAGPLAVQDLAALTAAAPGPAALARRIRGLLTTSAGRSMQTAGLAGRDRYQFAHESLLAYAQADENLSDPDYRHRIHRWAEAWRTAGWPPPASDGQGTPQYLLDTYPSTLAQDAVRLARLASDPSWVEAAIVSAGAGRVLTDLRRAAAANPAETRVAAALAAVTGQAHNLRAPHPVDQHGYVLRQLWMQTAELADHDAADDIRCRLQSRPGPGPVPQWTTRRTSRALSAALGRHAGAVAAVAVLADGGVITGGVDGRVLAWDPAQPGAAPAELARRGSGVAALAVLADGQVVIGGGDGRVLLWNPARPGADPVELGRRGSGVRALAVPTDGRVVSGGTDGRLLLRDPADPFAGPVELGCHDSGVRALAAFADGRVVSGGTDGRVLVWDSALPGADPDELGRHDGWVEAAAVLADGRVVTAGTDRRALVWDPAHPGADPVELGRRRNRVRATAVLADGRVVSGGTDGRVLLWDPADPGADPVELGRSSWVDVVAALPHGRVITGGFDGQVLMWDLADPGAGPVELGRRRHSVEAEAVAVLADGRVVAGGTDRRVVVWDPARLGAGLVELGRHAGWVEAAAVLPDGRVVTAGFDGQVLVWDPARLGAGPVELGRRRQGVEAVTVLADGRVVTGGADGRLLVWDPAHAGSGPVELGRHDGWVGTMAALTDGRVVSGGTDKRVLVWNPAQVSAGPEELGRHDGWVRAVAVLPGGRVVSGGAEGRVLMWDPADPGAGPEELGRHDGWVRAVAVLSDGRVISGGADQRVLIWNPAEAGAQVVQLACSVITLATAPPGPARSDLVIAHQGNGLSCWSFAR